MQVITPFLWFEANAQEAVDLYLSAFEEAELVSAHRMGPNDFDPLFMATVRLAGLEFMLMNGGSMYKPTPAVSYFITCPDQTSLDDLWAKLSVGGEVLMALDKYAWSERYGWLNDRFGVSWQFTIAPGQQSISPFLMYVGDQHGRATEAIGLYTSVLPDSSVDTIQRYGPGMHEPEQMVMHATFHLAGWRFMGMDSGAAHAFSFTPANSFLVSVGDQSEVDHLWNGLIADGGEPGQCGWLKDPFGVSWQIIPTALGQLMGDPDPERAGRARNAMMTMTKIDIDALRQAADGRT